jgi:hypothetical protein
MHQNSGLLVSLLPSLAITAFFAYLTYSDVKRFWLLYQVRGATVKQHIEIAQSVLVISGTTIPFLLTQHEVLLPHHKIVVFAPECILLGICAGLCVAFMISSTQAQDAYNRMKRFMQREDYERFGKWAAANRAMAISALWCLGFAYLGIVATVFG